VDDGDIPAPEHCRRRRHVRTDKARSSVACNLETDLGEDMSPT
jgi:hypothetical protein